MNRDIEFRVWDDHYKYMNYKVLVGMYGNWEDVKDDENYTACSIWIEPKNVDYKCEPHWSHFEPYHKEIKLMQYTGLKDKNGKKIFEGDIVHYYDFTSVYSREITGKVIYSQDCMFEIEYDDEFIKNHKTTRPLVCNEHPIFTEKKIEVIGNIYENDLESKGE